MESRIDDPVLSEPLTRRKPCGYASETAAAYTVARNSTIVAGLLTVALAGSLYVNFLDRQTWRNARVNFVGVQKDGSLVALDAAMFSFPVTEATLRSALINFVHKHMERVKGRVVEDYASSLQFLTQPLRAKRSPSDRANIRAVMEGVAEEVRVDPLSVTLRNSNSGCEQKECQASIVLKKTYYHSGVAREQQSTVELSFVVRPKEVTDRQVKAENPMGLVILDFHEYAYFEPDEPAKMTDTAGVQP